jgi:chromosome segregation protein
VRLERLDLAPYGRFADRALKLSRGAALHVVLGPNESGKTTTLSAIGDLLFGFPGQTSYAFQHDQRLLRVGGVFVLADGSRLDIRRRKGNKDTLLDGQDKPISDAELRRSLGGVDRRTFETEFGLSQRALREGGEALLRAGGSLAETLAAGSASLGALNGLRDRLGAEADALFTARRSVGKPFYIALDLHDAAERKLRDAIVTADALKAADAEVRDARSREIDLKAQHEETGRAIARRRRAQRVAGRLARLDAIAGELAGLADLPLYATPALQDARAALDADRAKRGEIDRLAAEDSRDAAAKAALGLDERLAAQGAAIDALNQQSGAVRKDEDDLPRRLGAQAQARAQLDAIARRLGLGGHAGLMDAAPTDASLARARKLLDERRRASERKARERERHETAVAERERLSGLVAAPATDPAPLKRRLDGLADARDDADRLRRERAQAEREAVALTEEAAALDPSVADLDALARASLPDDAALQARARIEDETEERARAAEQKQAALRAAVEAGEAELAKRESAAAVATRADWERARAWRETALDRLGQALEGSVEARAERFASVRALTLAADATVDSVLADSARAARLQAAREDLAARRAEAERAEGERASGLAARDAARAESRALWAVSGIAPAAPAAMGRWRAQVAKLLARRATLQTRRAELAALAEKVAAARVTLAAWLSDAGSSAPDSYPFEEAHRAAIGQVDALNAAWLAAREVEIARGQADKAIAEAERAVAREIAAEAVIVAEWPAALADLRLRPAATPEELEAALAAWAAVPLPRQTLQDATHRIATMQDDIARFEAEVAEVIAAAAPSLSGVKGRDSLPKLTAALAEARRAADERARLDRAAAARSAARLVLEAERTALQTTLARARESLGAPDDEALAPALEKLERRRALEAEQTSLGRELIEIGDGLGEAKLRLEQAELDLSVLPSEIAVSEQTQARLLEEIGAAAAAVSGAEARREALAKGRDAAGAARERTEAAGELVDIAERWLVRAAAARLAARAIERHRATAQDPLIARAGELFRVATAGGFADLSADYDEADRPILVARRAGGERVRIEGLSEGARDQLFLSLRLALIERRAGEPLPFIGDDLLASFDDERTRRTLELLAEFGARTQTIVFTHHARVAELAKGLAEVVEMGG